MTPLPSESFLGFLEMPRGSISAKSIILGVADLEDWEFRRLSRYAPGSLDALCQCTKFTRKEIRAIYNGFKQDCPSGTVSKERFKDLYSGFFPLGGKSFKTHKIKICS